jgi:hypothetical protein
MCCAAMSASLQCVATRVPATALYLALGIEIDERVTEIVRNALLPELRGGMRLRRCHHHQGGPRCRLTRSNA